MRTWRPPTRERLCVISSSQNSRVYLPDSRRWSEAMRHSHIRVMVILVTVRCAGQQYCNALHACDKLRRGTIQSWSFRVACSLCARGIFAVGGCGTANPLCVTSASHHGQRRNLDRAVTWYQQMLGFAVRQRGRQGAVRFVELAIPGFGVALIQDRSALLLNPSPGARTAPYWIHMCFHRSGPQRRLSMP